MAVTEVSSAPSHPLIESDYVEGAAVYDANGKQIGTIKSLVIEKVSGHVVYAVTSSVGRSNTPRDPGLTVQKGTGLHRPVQTAVPYPGC
jgi:sporulation protein YlmC with PRC-barrel domain